MKINNYSVRVNNRDGDERGYVRMRHGETYVIGLHNDNLRRCDASVEIDGKHVGTFRMHGWHQISLERPANDTGCFTFYREGSDEAASAGIRSGADANGLITVTFTPEKRPKPVLRASEADVVRGRGLTYGGMKGMSSGGTGLSGTSEQRFTRADELDLDHAQKVVIRIRLVCDDSAESPRPLVSTRENATPPRVD